MAQAKLELKKAKKEAKGSKDPKLKAWVMSYREHATSCAVFTLSFGQGHVIIQKQPLTVDTPYTAE